MNPALATSIIVAIIAIIPATVNLIVSIINSKKTNGIKKIRIETTRRYLVDNFSDLEQNISKSNEQKKEIYNAYDEYIKLGGNSYIHTQFDRLVKTGKL